MPLQYFWRQILHRANTVAPLFTAPNHISVDIGGDYLHIPFVYSLPVLSQVKSYGIRLFTRRRWDRPDSNSRSRCFFGNNGGQDRLNKRFKLILFPKKIGFLDGHGIYKCLHLFARSLKAQECKVVSKIIGIRLLYSFNNSLINKISPGILKHNPGFAIKVLFELLKISFGNSFGSQTVRPSLMRCKAREQAKTMYGSLL